MGTSGDDSLHGTVSPSVCFDGPNVVISMGQREVVIPREQYDALCSAIGRIAAALCRVISKIVEALSNVIDKVAPVLAELAEKIAEQLNRTKTQRQTWGLRKRFRFGSVPRKAQPHKVDYG